MPVKFPSTVDPEAVRELARQLLERLGPRAVTTDLRQRQKVSQDGAAMSPILAAQLPLGLADLVCFPVDAAEIATAVGAAVGLGVPVTPRGQGTGNYGQGVPMGGGLLLDLSRATTVAGIADGVITADAGARLITLENTARAEGLELWMYPSTAQSSVGGFLSGGSGGTGTIEHGLNHQGFVAELDVVHAVPDARLVHVQGEDAAPYVHTYGTAGIIARAGVRLAPGRDWRGLWASFPDFPAALSVLRPIGSLDPLPRLVSADVARVAAALPADPAIPAGRASLRAILDPAAVPAATALIERAGGRVEAVRDDPGVQLRLSTLSYNHPTWWLMNAEPDRWFHVEVGGDALIDRIDEVHAVFPDGMLHIEAAHTAPIGMLNGRYESPERVYAGIERLRELGVGVHDCHQWHVDFEVDRTRALAARTDPHGLLNPGKLTSPRAGRVPVPR